MEVGCLESIPFEVSESTVRTIRNYNFTASASHAKHSILGGATLLEYTGADAADLSFDVFLSEDWQGEIRETLRTLDGYTRSGTAVSFVLGNQPIGSYKWLITSYTVKASTYGSDGRLTSATVSLKLAEYAKW